MAIDRRVSEANTKLQQSDASSAGPSVEPTPEREPRRGPPARAPQPDEMLGLQQTLGNAHVQRLLRSATAARAPGDTHSEAPGVAPGADAAVAAAAESTGQPLPSSLAPRLETALGASLGDVRVHTGSASDAAAAALNAQAYTVGQDIHLGNGNYAPESAAGQRLIAHEVAHTVQQRGASALPAQDGLAVSSPGDAHEVNAEQFAQAFSDGTSASVTPGTATTSTTSRAMIHRAPGDPPATPDPAAPPVEEYVPEMSVKPDSAEIKLGEVHTEQLDILNTAKAPQGTTFSWGGGIHEAGSPVLSYENLTPLENPHAQLTVKGQSPGVTTIDANIQHQVPGGPPVVTPGPTPQITVKLPKVTLKVTGRQALGGPDAGNPEDPTRLSVGDQLVVSWTFENGKDLGANYSLSTVGTGLESVLAPQAGVWTAADTYEQKYMATATGAAKLDLKFRFADMTDEQAIADTVEGHVEMSRQEFLNAASEGTAMVVTADQKATAWMDSLAAAYSDAWKNHTDALKDQAEFEKLVAELIMGAALAFVPGGVGGMIGKAMGNATMPAAFMCDGVKDLAKWGMRRIPPPATGSGLTAYPTDPFMWSNLKGVRIHNEIGIAAAQNEAWLHKARASDVDLMLDFDPATVMEDALKIDGTDLRTVAPVDVAEMSKTFEKGFWSGWLEQYGYKVSKVTDNLIGDPVQFHVVENAGKKVKERCESLGLDITPYMEASRQAMEAKAAQERDAQNGAQ